MGTYQQCNYVCPVKCSVEDESEIPEKLHPVTGMSDLVSY